MSIREGSGERSRTDTIHKAYVIAWLEENIERCGDIDVDILGCPSSICTSKKKFFFQETDTSGESSPVLWLGVVGATSR